MDIFEGDEEDFDLYTLGNGVPVEFLKDGLMCLWEQVWAGRQQSFECCQCWQF